MPSFDVYERGPDGASYVGSVSADSKALARAKARDRYGPGVVVQ